MTARLTWQGGSHNFSFAIGELRALQDETDSGPGQVLARLNSGAWRIDDLICTLKFGLIGGGMDPEKAGRLVQRVFDEGNLFSLALTASAALTARLVGNPDEPKGGAPEKGDGESLADGTSATSTPLAE